MLINPEFYFWQLSFTIWNPMPWGRQPPRYRFFICGARVDWQHGNRVTECQLSIYRPSIPRSRMTPPFIISTYPPPNSPTNPHQFKLFPIAHTAKNPPSFTRFHLINPSHVRKSHQSAALSHRFPRRLPFRQNLQRYRPRQPPQSLRPALRKPRYGPGTLPLGPAPRRRGFCPASGSDSFDLSWGVLQAGDHKCLWRGRTAVGVFGSEIGCEDEGGWVPLTSTFFTLSSFSYRPSPLVFWRKKDNERATFFSIHSYARASLVLAYLLGCLPRRWSEGSRKYRLHFWFPFVSAYLLVSY